MECSMLLSALFMLTSNFNHPKIFRFYSIGISILLNVIRHFKWWSRFNLFENRWVIDKKKEEKKNDYTKNV